MTWRRHAKLVAVFVLVAAVVNVPVAVMLVRNMRMGMPGSARSLTGTAARDFPWPERRPKGHPEWPAPTQVDIVKSFGVTGVNATSTEGRDTGGNGWQMTSYSYGWPLRCLSESRRWWTWNDPALKTTEQMEVPLHLLWSGVILNPLIVAVGVWVVAVAPFAAWKSVRAWRRRRLGLCERCSYPRVPAGVCPECGTA